MLTREDKLSFENLQIKINNQQNSVFDKAKIILNNPKYNKSLKYLLKYLYLNFPIKKFQQENPIAFIDHLYMLSYEVTSIIINWKIAHKDPDAYINDPDLRCQMMEIIYQDEQYNYLKSELITNEAIQYLIGLKLAFLKMMDDIYNLYKTKPLEYLIMLHNGPHSDSRDHMSKTCFDRAKLINELLVFGLHVRDTTIEPLNQNIIISYLKNFYGPASLKEYLPKKLMTSEEKTLVSLIDLYEKITEKNLAQLSIRFSFMKTKDVELRNIFELLTSMRSIIQAYQEVHKKRPYYMTNILWRINGLIPPQIQAKASLRVAVI